MIKLHLLRKQQQTLYVAFSGGVDSVALTHRLLKAKHNVKLLNINHNTPFSETEKQFTIDTANKYGLEYCLFDIKDEKPKDTSLECFWSLQRAKIFQKMDLPVVTGHNLDDAVEWYIMSCMQGTSKILDYQNKNVYRPLITNKKAYIEQYVREKGLAFIQDESNFDISFNLRNKVRHNLLPETLKVFPGIYTTVRRLLIEKQNRVEKI